MTEFILSDTIKDELARTLVFGFLGFAFAMLLTPIYTHFAYKYEWWKKVRTSSMTGEKAKVFSRLHAYKHKRNIPTMAGLVILIAILAVTILFNLSRSQTYLPITAIIGAGLVGLLDDVINLHGANKDGRAGLNSRVKLLMITIVASLGGVYFYTKLGFDSIYVPFINGGTDIFVGVLLVPIFILVVVSAANSVNITDGLDGLAGGLLVFAYASYTAIAFLQGNYGLAGFCMTIVGVLLSYVWFNIFPARFFMGDIGSFALGTGLGVVAMLTGTVVLLPIIGIVFVFETATVIIQVLSKKFRNGKKVFLSAPIHHHFEALGWPEAKVTMRFWVIGQVAGFVGVVLAVIGGHI